jgi:hypothetical protein
MAQTLNEAIAYNPHYKDSPVFPGTDIIVSLAGPELWRRVPEFNYKLPLLPSVWPRARNSALLMLCWMLFVGWFLRRSARHLKAD